MEKEVKQQCVGFVRIGSVVDVYVRKRDFIHLIRMGLGKNMQFVMIVRISI
jgi:hypothetical protein